MRTASCESLFPTKAAPFVLSMLRPLVALCRCHVNHTLRLKFLSVQEGIF